MFQPGSHSRDNGSWKHGAALIRLPWLWLQLLLRDSQAVLVHPYPAAFPR